MVQICGGWWATVPRVDKNEHWSHLPKQRRLHNKLQFGEWGWKNDRSTMDQKFMYNEQFSRNAPCFDTWCPQSLASMNVQWTCMQGKNPCSQLNGGGVFIFRPRNGFFFNFKYCFNSKNVVFQSQAWKIPSPFRLVSWKKLAQNSEALLFVRGLRRTSQFENYVPLRVGGWAVERWTDLWSTQGGFHLTLPWTSTATNQGFQHTRSDLTSDLKLTETTTSLSVKIVVCLPFGVLEKTRTKFRSCGLFFS